MRLTRRVEKAGADFGSRARAAVAAIALGLAIVAVLAPGGFAAPLASNQDYDYAPSPDSEMVPAPVDDPGAFSGAAVPPPPAGSDVFALNCAACHGTAGEGTAHAPHLIGESSGVFSHSRDEVYGFVSTRMPFSSPGSLTEAEYWAVVDFLRAANGL